jgi:hypothetical protein
MDSLDRVLRRSCRLVGGRACSGKVTTFGDQVCEVADGECAIDCWLLGGLDTGDEGPARIKYGDDTGSCALYAWFARGVPSDPDRVWRDRRGREISEDCDRSRRVRSPLGV